MTLQNEGLAFRIAGNAASDSYELARNAIEEHTKETLELGEKRAKTEEALRQLATRDLISELQGQLNSENRCRETMPAKEKLLDKEIGERILKLASLKSKVDDAQM
jgi:ribosomal protein L19E